MTSALDYAAKANKIFVMSDSFIRIKELVDCDSSTIDDISEVITLDPALASTVLKLANSSFFNYPGKIDTVSKAVLVLGITEVYNLVIAYFTTQAFQEMTAELSYLNEFWENSVDCALLVKFIGRKARVSGSERLFILGLLHNLGELIIQQFNPEAVIACAEVNIKKLPWQKQQEHLGFTYADVTAELLKLWQIPFTIVNPIRYQNIDDEKMGTVESKLLYIARRAMLQDTYLTRQPITKLVSNEMFTATNLCADDIREAHDFCNLERLSILSLLNPSTSSIY